MKLTVVSTLFYTGGMGLFFITNSVRAVKYENFLPQNFRDALANYRADYVPERDKLKKNDPNYCGEENRTVSAGKMWFTAFDVHCRAAIRPITYLNRANEFTTADPGDIIAVPSALEVVYFPGPKVPDCYLQGNVGCESEEEFCMTDRHEKWGKWGKAPSGLTADQRCALPYFSWNVEGLDDKAKKELNESVVEDYCGGVYCEDGNCDSFGGWVNKVARDQGAWNPVRGKCVKYRKKGQSCYFMQKKNKFYQNPFLGTADAEFNNGGGINRPFVCAPGLECKDIGQNINTCVNPSEGIKSLSVPRKEWETCGDHLPCDDGLVCTGTEIEILNNTCVVPREPDVCYAGPWWDSMFCPRTGLLNNGTIQTPPCGGMSPEMAIESLLSWLLMAPGESVAPLWCTYWVEGPLNNDFNTSGWPERHRALRYDIYKTFDTLWPKHLDGFESLISFEEIERDIFGIPSKNIDYDTCKTALIKDFNECSPESGNSMEPICILHQELVFTRAIKNQANKVWSLIHWVMANLKKFMSPDQVEASRAIALILRDNWACNDCRGFFNAGVLGGLGYPPLSNKAVDHEKYWNLGHNEASEHVATTRGGHPWMLQLAGQNGGTETAGVSNYQNPFYMPYEQAHLQWKQWEQNADGECVHVPNKSKKSRKSSKKSRH